MLSDFSILLASVATALIPGSITLLVTSIFHIPDKWRYTLFVFLVCVLSLMTYLFIQRSRQGKQYARLEKRIPSRIFARANGNITFSDDQTVPGVVCFSDDGVHVLSTEIKPQLFWSISAKEVRDFEFFDVSIIISLKDDSEILIETADIIEVQERLQEKGWISF